MVVERFFERYRESNTKLIAATCIEGYIISDRRALYSPCVKNLIPSGKMAPTFSKS